MPVHDWTRVDHGTFHDFHQGWAPLIRSALNNGLLPPDYEAKVEQHKPNLAVNVGSAPPTRAGNSIVVRQSGERVVALIELVSPVTKSSRQDFQAFTEKVIRAITNEAHVLVVDLIAPGSHDPRGTHSAIWEALTGLEAVLPNKKRLSVASYSVGQDVTAYLEPVAVGEPLPDMPLFLEPGAYVSVPLEATYTAAFAGIARRTRDALNAPG